MEKGTELIFRERREQIEKHGRTVQSDVINNSQHQLLHGIMLLVSNVALIAQGFEMEEETFNDLLPEGWDPVICKKMMGKDVVGQLAIIGAFAGAEIDRIQATDYNKLPTSEADTNH